VFRVCSGFRVLFKGEGSEISLDVGVLDRLLQQYGVQKMQGIQVLPPLVNATLCKQEFFAFKIQGSTEWMDLTFADVWTSISWSPSLKVKYSIGDITKMSQLGHYETDENVHWEHGSRVNTCELPSLTRVRTRGRSSR
jgi:hypothetical protein